MPELLPRDVGTPLDAEGAVKEREECLDGLGFSVPPSWRAEERDRLSGLG